MKRLLHLILICALAACGGKPESPPPPAPQVDGETIVFPADSPQFKSLQSATVEVVRGESLQLSGRLVWDEERTVRVFAPVAGRIVKLLAQAGQTIPAGAPLATVSSPDFGQMQAEAAKAAADLAVADKALARARELAQHGVIPAKDLEQAQADQARAAAEDARTRARAHLYRGAGAVDQQLPLLAPIGGVVVERNANPGQEVRPDQAQPSAPALYVISDPTRLWVQLELPEAALPHVKPGMAFTLKGAGIESGNVGGKIEWVADNIDPMTRSTRARGSVANPERRLKAEMFVTAELEIEQQEHVRLPATAVVLLGDTQHVFIDAGNGRYERRQVVAREAGLGRMRVVSGLVAGERVVTDGALLLQQLLAFHAK